MPANSPAQFSSPAGEISNINIEDEDFGDFLFSSPYSSHTPSFSHSAPTFLSTASENDEDWGDFVSSSKEWEKPKGAIPLSVFGEGEEDETEMVEIENGFGFCSLSAFSDSRSGTVGKLNDLVEKIYGQIDEGSWDFKDAMLSDGRDKPIEEEEETDPVEIEGSGVLENGFGSYSLSAYSDSRSASVGKLNDLIEKLYGQIDVGFDEGFDKMDEGDLEVVTAASENGSGQVFVNRLENGYKGLEQFNMDGQERGPADIFAAHEKVTNGSLDHNHSVKDKTLHDMIPSFENGTLSSSTNGFKIEFPEYATINGFTEKIQGDQAEMVHSPEEQKDIKEVEWNMWDFDYLNISSNGSGKKNLYGNSEDHIEHNTGAGKMDYSPVDLTSIIQNLYEKTDSPRATLPSQNSVNNGQEIDQLEKSSADVDADIDFDQYDWEFQNAVEIGEAEKTGAYESDQNLANESASYTLVDIYCRLKEESLALIVHHLSVLKVSALPGATPEVMKINEEIQEAYGNLQEMICSEDACAGKQIVSRINQLLSVTRTSNCSTVEKELHLSERLLAAEKYLNAAVDLFEHSSSVLQILRIASREQQLFYINAWSKLASACAEELQLGAKIWTQSLDGNISKQILNKGNKYFLAVGEVYRVSKLLKATVRFYMPWLLSNLENSNEIVDCLGMGHEAWINSGLEDALRSISSSMDLDDEGLAKTLLESIDFIDEVNAQMFQVTAFQDKNGFCKFSLLPLDKLPGIKTVVWNGDCYIAKIANLWANRISPDPPELPSIAPS